MDDDQEKMDIGRVLQRGFAGIGANAAGFFLLAVLFAGIPSALLQFLQRSLSERVDAARIMFSGSFVGLHALGFMATMLCAYILQAAVVRSMADAEAGRPVDIARSLTGALSRILPLLGLLVVTAVASILVMVVAVIPAALVAVANGPFLSVVIAALVMIPTLLTLYIFWSVSVAALVEEDAGVFGSLSRSAQLTRGARWRILGLMLIVAAAWSIVGFATGRLAGSGASPNLVLVLDAIFAIVSGLINAAMLASLYIELRTIREGGASEGLVAVFE